MNKVKPIAIILIVIFSTLIVVMFGINNIGIHKPIVFSDASYLVLDEKLPVKEIKTSAVVSNPKNQITKATVQSNSIQQTPKIINQDVVREQTVKVSNTSTIAPSQKVKATPVKSSSVPTKIQTNNKTLSNSLVSKSKQDAKKQEPITNQQAKIVQKTVEKPPVVTKKIEQSVPQKKVLTESEELVVWNKWRSDLQNQIMRDTKIGAPQGTVFRFSFTVDKFGNMSNIKVWSDNPVYTDLAVRVIKPIIASYQRKAILEFPEGTKRTIVNANGGFAISNRTEYSTPENYNDVEKIKTTQYK